MKEPHELKSAGMLGTADGLSTDSGETSKWWTLVAVQADEPQRHVQDHVTRLHSEQVEFTQSMVIVVFLDDLFRSSSSMGK